MNLRGIWGFISWFPRIPKHTKEQQKELYKKSVQSVSTGNYSIQSGHYITKNQIQELKNEVMNCCN
jgi:hypothetical protein